MKKHDMLGVDNNGNCCILSCLLPFSLLVGNQVETSDFQHSSTNWCGCDTTERTLALKNYELTGNKIILENPIVFHGSDSDMGHSYSWVFSIFEILEIREKSKG